MPIVAVGWTDTAFARAQWGDAPNLDATLVSLLTSSYEVCRRYDPIPEYDDLGAVILDDLGAVKIPERWKSAQVLQARELYAAARRDGDVILLGDDGGIRARPLTSSVRLLLRPPSSKMVVG